ncbi:MAG TPA: AAA family ATPase, partial [Candidatus Nanoarchaeia archaeon]|nr:AAA family ATPase [Candidatus Nanoarchaeia archaeon]
MQTPWFSKYAPANIKEVLEQPIASLIKHASTNPRGKAMLICGPAGSGKTCCVESLANGEGYELIEVNASSVRDSGAISSVVGNASLTRSLFGKRVILVDDIDSLGGSDRGGIT